ncbi:MAG: uroporphyrinogen-III C-methyltransferase [Deltaproteobacteria bacterium]|nr:uroporphyrinogen-III C-methyltransferase [Deltaproteobacteria bacterium]
MMKKDIGKVYIVGAGPGDPGLITVKGLRLLEMADVIVYDHLINFNLLDWAKPNAEKINVGKQVGKRILQQKEINKMLVKEAGKGKIVVRLKGGDPFIFGRGGEEVEALARHGIPFEVVPGVTSAVAAPAYAGIPLTHRGLASSVALVTGHEDPAKEFPAVDFKKIAQSVNTVVCLMGVGNIDSIIKQVKESGRSLATPVAVVEKGTCSDQRVIEGTLRDILPKTRKARLRPPAVIVVGEVTKLRHTNSWFESLPLVGKTVAVTRAREQARPLIDLLEQAGAEVILFPTIEIIEPKSFKQMDAKINRIKEYDYLVFTSANGVKSFLSRMQKLHKDLRCLNEITIAALGEITAQVLREHLLYPEIIPRTFTSKHLAGEFKKEKIKGKKALLMRSEISSDLLPRELKKMGAKVDEVSAYTVRKPRVDSKKVAPLFKERKVDLVTFTSPSTFANFCALMKGKPLAKLLNGVKVAAIGPVTKKEIVKQGIRVPITAARHTASGLVDAIITYYNSKKR